MTLLLLWVTMKEVEGDILNQFLMLVAALCKIGLLLNQNLQVVSGLGVQIEARLPNTIRINTALTCLAVLQSILLFN
jgi:hypothetical protein